MEISQLSRQGEAFRNFKQSPAYKLLKEWLDEKIKDDRNMWLNCPLEQAEMYRAKASVYKEVIDFIDKSVMMGEKADLIQERINKQKEIDNEGIGRERESKCLINSRPEFTLLMRKNV